VQSRRGGKSGSQDKKFTAEVLQPCIDFDPKPTGKKEIYGPAPPQKDRLDPGIEPGTSRIWNLGIALSENHTARPTELVIEVAISSGYITALS
jgi:hypothetical protein